MMKMNRKKWLCGVAVCLCLTGSLYVEGRYTP